MFNPDYLAHLRCPVSGGPLQFNATHSQLLSPQAQLAYPIENGIPILLAEKALPYAPEQASADTLPKA